MLCNRKLTHSRNLRKSSLNLNWSCRDTKRRADNGILLIADSPVNKIINPKKYIELKQKTKPILTENTNLHTKISSLHETNESQFVEIVRLSKSVSSCNENNTNLNIELHKLRKTNE